MTNIAKPAITATAAVLTISLAACTRGRDGVAANVGRIVLCPYSDVRLIAAMAPSSIAVTMPVPTTRSTEVGRHLCLAAGEVAEDRGEDGDHERERDGDDREHPVHEDRAQLDPLGGDRADHA